MRIALTVLGVGIEIRDPIGVDISDELIEIVQTRLDKLNMLDLDLQHECYIFDDFIPIEDSFRGPLLRKLREESHE